MNDRNIEKTISVIMTSYNHEKYLSDAIEGVLSQKTDYSMEIIIHDDASTDRSQEIIRNYANQYPQTIKTILQTENQYSKGNEFDLWGYLFAKASGKYIAICECDDFWCDSQKLNTQIDFMEKHCECSMTLHNAWMLDCRNNERILLNSFAKEGYISPIEQVQTGLGSKFPATASYVFRRKLLDDMPKFFSSYSVKDYPLRQYMATKGMVYYFSNPMSVYRYMVPGSYMDSISVSNRINCSYQKYIIEMVDFYQKFNEYTGYKFDEILRRKIASDYIGLASVSEEKECVSMVEKSNGNVKLIEKCYELLNLKNKEMNEKINAFISQNVNVWIYGTSQLSLRVTKTMAEKGLQFLGYVVSDGYAKSEYIGDKEVIYLSEALSQDSKAAFIIIAQPINVFDIKHNLEKKGVKNYISFFD